MSQRRVRALIASLATVAAIASPAAAATPTDPGRWTLSSTSQISFTFWQGHSSSLDSKGSIRLHFAGTNGLYTTDPAFKAKASLEPGIPSTLTANPGFNHIGDPTWDASEGGRLLLGLECYYPTETPANRCGRGAIAVADPASLKFRYAVALDPTDIAKAMWVESSPDGSLVWTSSGKDLLAYRASDISTANAFTVPHVAAVSPIRPVRRLVGAVPASGVTGAAFWGGRLFLAGQSGASFQVWSVDTATGESRLEVERTISGESEGLDFVPNGGGVMQWSVMPVPAGGLPHTWAFAMMMSLKPTSPPALTVTPSTTTLKRRVTRKVTLSVAVDGGPAAFAKVSIAGKSVLTDRSGRASVSVKPARKGKLSATASLTGASSGKATLTVS